MNAAGERIERRRAARDDMLAAGPPRYPAELPITARRHDLLAAISDHQVVIVAGETGSGKSTQLPKLCLELGRGVAGLVGHTQPRRVAARTIAERVAEELGTSIGAAVGYTVRFHDRVGDQTLIRVMTDGILLGELARDPLLGRYDTLIIDEAHERSLNIDFILGYLRRLLPQRPDLKVIVTSATIDTERFAHHFAGPAGPAPVVEVTGRTYPVEIRYRPVGVEPDDDRDQVQAIADAVDELAAEGPGDVLVFLSGEREIHDTADALRARHQAGTDVLPLYARLSAAEQHRIFQPHPGRRIVLSTNVAETSLTVPGVRYVVDAGAARVSRYSRRLKVQRLPIEPISQASANQRAGRCGRVAPGICIRLYAEEDFAARPAFTQPEILRTNLAAVILQMTAIGLGDVGAFPFLEAPDEAAVRDGYLLLEELGAIGADAPSGGRRLTAVGRRLARLPVDPRLGRMVLEAERHDCVREVLVIAAALSIQDPRERPQDDRRVADELHRRFDVAGSDLLSLVALWDHLREQQRRLSSNQFRKLCRAEHLNYLRVREWQDLFSQLRQVAGDLGIRARPAAGHPDRVHQAILTGLLSHVGMRVGDGREFRGARGATFVIAPGSVLARRPPRWVMAAELMETNRLWARRVAAIEPGWAEQAAAHLVRRSYGEPRWDERQGRAVTAETVTLYGLPIVSGRTVGYDRIDPAVARELFIRHALVQGEWSTRHAFVDRNEDFVARVREMEERVRRTDLLDDEARYDFYDARIPADVVSVRHFDRWWQRAQAADPTSLDLTEAVLAAGPHGVVRLADYPDTWRHGDVELAVTYRYDPGGPLDGVVVHVPVTALNQLSDAGFDWQVPGHRRELVGELVRSLPKDTRRRLIPAAETTAAAFARLGPPAGRLVDALARALGEVAGVAVAPDSFAVASLPAHLRVNFVVSGPDGGVLDVDTDMAALRTRLAATARAAVAAAVPLDERRGIVDWDLGSLPHTVEAPAGHHVVRGHPALLDDDDSVSLRILTNADLQARVMRGGVRRLLLLTAAPAARHVAGSLGRPAQIGVARMGMTVDDLAGQCVVAAVDRVLDDHDLPWDEPAFRALQADVRARAPAVAADALAVAADVAVAAQRVRDRLASLAAPSLRAAGADAEAHLERLVGPGFVLTAGSRRLPDVRRYVRGIEYRLERLPADVARDARRVEQVVALEDRFARATRRPAGAPVAPRLAEIRWQLEELRISVFAQPLGARGPVSPQRIDRALGELGA